MKIKQFTSLTAAAFLSTLIPAHAADSNAPMVAPDLVFDEMDGIVTFEAEHFHKQTLIDKRAWHIISSKSAPDLKPDPDPSHAAGASGGAYLESLPDTRVTHEDKLIGGENFTDDPGQLAVVHYKVNIKKPGRYYVWVRSFSTGTEDNGVHVGINGQWPESGQRWQTVKKNSWSWDCRQRTPQVHVGVPMQLFLDIEKPGEHEIMFSMREDGFEMDKFVLAADKEFTPDGLGPALKLKSGMLPEGSPVVTESVPSSTSVSEPLPNGKGTVKISGDLMQWHKVSLTLDGPFAKESDTEPNPFTDLALNVTFTHESGTPSYTVPGYFAADGNAAETSAEAGTKWRAHMAPEKSGTWKYLVSFTKGKHAALDGKGEVLKPFDGITGSFIVAPTDKTGKDFRANGRLQYVGKHHLQFNGSKKYFLKAGPDSPETLLAYSGFDNTSALKPDKARVKTWEPHLRDWKEGDPTWQGGKGKGLIGALNYLSVKGVNVISFITYNVTGDGNNVWPFIEPGAKLHYDCSKLDQWGVVFDYATANGLYLHFKLQEQELDDNFRDMDYKKMDIKASLDGGDLGPERKLYCREFVARYAHNLALNWNIGEENTQSTKQVQDMVEYIHKIDAYKNHIILHTFPPEQEKKYRPLLGDKSLLTGISMQKGWKHSQKFTLQWIRESAAAGRPWVVAHDEQSPASLGVPPDPGYRGFSGKCSEDRPKGPASEGYVAADEYDLHDIRKALLWGHFLAGGAGVEYYFGYDLDENDLHLEDFCSRDMSWDYCRIALDFFRDHPIPFWEMKSANALVGNKKDDNSKYCFAKEGEVYLVFLSKGGDSEIDLSATSGNFSVKWFNPREGGPLQTNGNTTIAGGKKGSIAAPSSDDWLAVIVKE